MGIIGAGNFTKMTLLPILNKYITNVKLIASKGIVNGTILAKKYNINFSTDYNEVILDNDVELILITTGMITIIN